MMPCIENSWSYSPSVSIVMKVGRDSHTNSLPARRPCAFTLPLPSVDPKSSR